MNILVLCTGNSCRSQMAEGFIRKLLLPGDMIYSAGVKPEPINQFAVQVMREVNIDISSHTSNHVDEYIDKPIDLVLTVCDNARENCPVFPKSVKAIHHNFTDPSEAGGTPEEKLDIYRGTRDEIQIYCTLMIKELCS